MPETKHESVRQLPVESDESADLSRNSLSSSLRNVAEACLSGVVSATRGLLRSLMYPECTPALDEEAVELLMSSEGQALRGAIVDLHMRDGGIASGDWQGIERREGSVVIQIGGKCVPLGAVREMRVVEDHAELTPEERALQEWMERDATNDVLYSVGRSEFTPLLDETEARQFRDPKAWPHWPPQEDE